MSIDLREYARHRKARGLAGGTHKAVQVAIDTGRLARSVTPDRKIASAELADAEWAAATHEDRIPLTGPTSPRVSVPTGPGLFEDLSKQDLLEFWAAHDELVHALVAAALDGADDPTTAAITLLERITARLRASAPDHGDPESLLAAEQLLDWWLTELLNPNED